MIELKALQGQVKNLVDDLRRQVPANAELTADLRREYAQAKAARRTGGTYESWLEDILDQAAVAWVLGCVFIRFLEDNRLVKPLWLGGPEPDASVERAIEARQEYLIANPTHNDRHWLKEAFGYLADLRATGKIFDQHNLVWRFNISGAASESLADFFRRGPGYVSLHSPALETRFLGDLYQDLSQHARKTYALLQTPDFVERFILSRSFERALEDFNLADMSIIDQTCGSGHFLLGAFHHLFNLWKKREPDVDQRVLAERALRQVTGVDINPFAIAIARFRLLVSALKLCNLTKLEDCPDFHIRTAVGDSLLAWGDHKALEQGDLLRLATGEDSFANFLEDEGLLNDYLRSGQYAVVVGNPPYVTVKDKVLNEHYRSLYSACSGKYGLAVPFIQRFFGLAKRGHVDGSGAGCVGIIVGNGFTKREFGKKIVEEFFASSVELTDVIDSSGAYIPGHGTPTLTLFGRNRLVSDRYSGAVRTVLSIRGEPARPDDAGKGVVWRAIEDQVDRPGSESEWVSCADWPRIALLRHPWSLSGGGARSLKEAMEGGAARRLKSAVDAIGIMSVTGEDDLFTLPSDAVARRLGMMNTMKLVEGDVVRDYSLLSTLTSIWPYDESLRVASLGDLGGVGRILTQYRSSLSRRKRFGAPMVERGFAWWEWQE